MNYQSLPNSSRYVQFMRERFPLTTHLPMILSFSCANIAIGTAALGKGVGLFSSLAACLITFLFFMRLRLFDELKDLEYDKIANPDRPLVRGLVKPQELLRIIFLALIFECLLVLSLSPAAIFAYLTALGFSLLMFKEFFIGQIIRPHLTTYAVIHTFVSVLMGYMIAAVSHHAALFEFPISFFIFGFINWALFNVFEFARKTFSRDEERAGIETYSSKFSSLGAIALTMSQVLIVILVGMLLTHPVLPAKVLWFQIVLAAALAAGMAWYLTAGTKRSAAVYRALAGFYIILTYIGFAMRNI